MNASLLHRAIEGDSSAWNELVTRYEALVYGTVLRTGLPAEEAGDACQQVWIALLEGGASIRDPHALPKWLAVTARRIAARRRTQVRAVGAIPLSDDLEDEGPAADERIQEDERLGAVRAAVGDLPEKCRTLLIALFETDLPSYAAVARDLDIPLGSIGPSRARCLARLHRILRQRGFEP